MRPRSSLNSLLPIVGVLLLAVALRTADLEGAPPGLQHDEVFHAHDAFTVRGGYTPLWFTSNAGNEPFFIYLMAVTTTLAGDNYLGIRLAGVVSGLAGLVLTYAWGRAAFGRRVGLWAALFMAVGFWPVWLGRVGLRAASLPAFVAATGWLYARALRSEGRATLRFALAGLMLGLSLYTYPAARAGPIVMAAFYVYLLALRRDVLARSPVEHLVFWLAAGLAYLPLGMALMHHPGEYLRVQQLSGPLEALRAGDPLPVLEFSARTLGMWFVRGDPLWRYNVAGRPVFGPLLGAVFALGIGVAAWQATRGKLHRPASGATQVGLMLAWLALGVLPSAITPDAPSFLRASAAMPATYLTLGLGLDALRGWLIERGGPWRTGWRIGLAGVAAATLICTLHDYFGVWVANPEVQRVYRTDLAAVAAYLRDHAPPGGVAISTSEPHHLDPFIFDYTPHTPPGASAPPDVHWFDGLYALVFPADDEGGWLFITREPEPDPRLMAYLDRMRVIEERRFGNGALAFQLYHLPPANEAPAECDLPEGGTAWVAEQLAFPPDDPQGVRRPVGWPVDFGGRVELLGYRSQAEARPGDWLQLTLVWRVLGDVRTPEPWAIFAHLLDESGQQVAGRDFLAVPASTWRASDVFVQLHDVPLDPGLAPGRYHLEVGLYTQAGGERFPVRLDGQPIGDRLLLAPVTVGP
jgi:4-amino-4-deoxy-L-arabinose transferase-like glycosyltransferase